jgi:hypothetical protein
VYLLATKYYSIRHNRRRNNLELRDKIINKLMFQIQIYIIVVLLLSSGAASGGLDRVLRQAEFIVDIYRQFPRGCIFIINCEAQQQGED